jgi:predicted GIY-YIG superfamily endonuclease
MIYHKLLRSHGAALKLEAAIKALTRAAKEKLIAASRSTPFKAAAS